MRINRIEVKMDEELVKQALIKLQDWVFKEAMTSRGGAQQMLSGEVQEMTSAFGDEHQMLEY